MAVFDFLFASPQGLRGQIEARDGDLRLAEATIRELKREKADQARARQPSARTTHLGWLTTTSSAALIDRPRPHRSPASLASRPFRRTSWRECTPKSS